MRTNKEKILDNRRFFKNPNSYLAVLFRNNIKSKFFRGMLNYWQKYGKLGKPLIYLK